MTKFTLLAAAAALGIAGGIAGTAGAQMGAMGGQSAMSGDAMTMPTMAADYVKAAGAGDKFEIDSSRLLLRTTKNAKLRAFANKMIHDHTMSTAQVKAAARKDGVAVPMPMLTAQQQGWMSEIQAATGTDRDKVYVQDQMASHQAALQVHQSYAANGDKMALKAAAAKIVPVVQGHIDMLNSMSSAMSAM